MKSKKLITVLLAAAVLAMLLTACSGQGTPQTDPTRTPGVSTEPSSFEQTVPEETKPTEPKTDDVIIHTDFGDLRYQEQWAQHMKVNRIASQDSVIVEFSTEIEDTEYLLFRVTLGGEGGYPAGTITDASGVTRNVYITMEEIVGNSNLSDTQLNRLYAMQEQINYILENLSTGGAES